MDMNTLEKQIAAMQPAELQDALDAARTPRSRRSDVQREALEQFEARYLQFGDADPSAIAAVLSSAPDGVYEVHWRLQNERPREQAEQVATQAGGHSPESGAYAMIMEDEQKQPPRPLRPRLAEEPDTAEQPQQKRKKKKKATRETDTDEPDAAALEDASQMINSDAPLTQAAMIGLADRTGKTNDDEIGRELDRRERPQRAVNWVHRAKQATLVTLAVGGAGLGTYFAGRLAKTANDQGERIQQKHQVIGDDAERLGANPYAPINALKGHGGDTQTKDTDAKNAGGAEKHINKSKGKGRGE